MKNVPRASTVQKRAVLGWLMGVGGMRLGLLIVILPMSLQTTNYEECILAVQCRIMLRG